MNNIKGSKNNPYQYDEYASLEERGEWRGGWVEGQKFTVYYTSSNNCECNNANGEIGSENNPFSTVAYNEMRNAGTWPGGYVNDHTPPTYYRSSEEQMSSCQSASSAGSESGCGCGSGSGSCRIIAGSQTVCVGPFQFLLSWDAGIANEGGAELHASDVENRLGNSVTTTAFYEPAWVGPFSVAIGGKYRNLNSSTELEAISTFIIPEIFREP